MTDNRMGKIWWVNLINFVGNANCRVELSVFVVKSGWIGILPLDQIGKYQRCYCISGFVLYDTGRYLTNQLVSIVVDSVQHVS